MNIPESLLADITGYCKANNLELDNYIVSALRQGHTVLKYGTTPKTGVKEITPPLEPTIVEVEIVTPTTTVVLLNNNDIYQED